MLKAMRNAFPMATDFSFIPGGLQQQISLLVMFQSRKTFQMKSKAGKYTFSPPLHTFMSARSEPTWITEFFVSWPKIQ